MECDTKISTIFFCLTHKKEINELLCLYTHNGIKYCQQRKKPFPLSWRLLEKATFLWIYNRKHEIKLLKNLHQTNVNRKKKWSYFSTKYTVELCRSLFVFFFTQSVRRLAHYVYICWLNSLAFFSYHLSIFCIRMKFMNEVSDECKKRKTLRWIYIIPICVWVSVGFGIFPEELNVWKLLLMSEFYGHSRIMNIQRYICFRSMSSVFFSASEQQMRKMFYCGFV